MPDPLSSALARLEAHHAAGWTVTLSLVAGAPEGARWECAGIGPDGRRVRASAATFVEALARACGLIEAPGSAPS
jgi:hypothetical protein